MSYKRLIPCIFILGGKAVKWFDDPTVVSEDVIALAKEYSDNGADELLVFDLSSTDQDHDESIELMKKINRVIRIPMVAGGNVKRQEDVKKILYTGAKRAMLNFSKPDSQKLIEEVANLSVHKFLAGHLGGEQQLGAQIEHNQIDLVIFLRDPVQPKKHEPDVNNAMRLCDMHNIPLATNLASAELLIKSLDRGDLEWREMYK